MDIGNHFANLATMAALVAIVTGYITTHLLKTLNSTWKQVLAWAVSIAVSFGGNYLGIGISAGLDVLWTIITGLAVGLVANGLFDVALVQKVLELIKAKEKPVTPAVTQP